MIPLEIPISDEAVRNLKVGDPVSLSGVLITGRDTVHKWMIETFIEKTRHSQGDDLEVYEAIKPMLDGSAIYHCGPVVSDRTPIHLKNASGRRFSTTRHFRWTP